MTVKISFLLISLIYFLTFDKILGFSCFVGVDTVYKSVKCDDGTKWCLKFENQKDSSDSIRQCDDANECEVFGDKCSSVQVGNLTNLPNSQLQCCCAGENCNVSSLIKINFSLFFILPIISKIILQ